MSTADRGRTYGGLDGDERAQERRSQLVEAALQIVGEAGIAAVTMRSVTRTARLSPRYFYESFSSRSDLLVAVVDDVVQRCTHEALTALREARPEPREQTRAVVLAVAHACETDPRIARLLFEQAGADDEVRAHLRRVAPQAVRTMSLALAGRGWSAEPASPRVQFDISALVGALGNVFLDWSAGRLLVDADELADLVTGLVGDMVRRRRSGPTGVAFGADVRQDVRHEREE